MLCGSLMVLALAHIASYHQGRNQWLRKWCSCAALEEKVGTCFGLRGQEIKVAAAFIKRGE